MKTTWSPSWLSSTQPRKQRKFRFNAPLHIRRSFLSAHLSRELHAQYKRRSFPLRKGDEVEILRGDSKGLRGAVARVDLSRARVYLDGIMAKKVDGSEVMRPLQPSNLRIVKFHLEDKRRLAALLKKREPAKAALPSPEKTKKLTPAKDASPAAQTQKPPVTLPKKPAPKADKKPAPPTPTLPTSLPAKKA